MRRSLERRDRGLQGAAGRIAGASVLEASAQAADAARSVVVEQVSNGVAVRMAVLYLTLAGSGTAAPVPTSKELA